MYERGWETNKREQTNSTAAAAVLAVLAVFVGLLVGWRRGKHGPVVFVQKTNVFFFFRYEVVAGLLPSIVYYSSTLDCVD